ncbi:protein kinase superfamily protein [Actinidia rufa]|uniref:Protein kinase superfamily protein n=1 Tax=Actinidia rufa TaxID=165716 RepID=A0A7J0F7U3_9ERIC|nr:protein kinase superfamily protein [Actinidia rufa]
MLNGTLHHHLHHQPPSLNWGIRLRVALDCAKALEFLHEHTTPSVIHRDFKSSNVLLDQEFRAKVSDFGLAKTGSDKINGQISTRVLGTTGYLAPEYASTGKLTTKSDVYSYGVVLLELLTGRVPVDTNRPPGEHVLVSWVAAIVAVCVQPEAEYRPLMTDVVQSLIPLVSGLGQGSGTVDPLPVNTSDHTTQVLLIVFVGKHLEQTHYTCSHESSDGVAAMMVFGLRDGLIMGGSNSSGGGVIMGGNNSGGGDRDSGG